MAQGGLPSTAPIRRAFDLLHAQVGSLDLEREPASVREAYGSQSSGQSALLARRLIEAGRTDGGFTGQLAAKERHRVGPLVGHPPKNASRVKGRLCPQFDRTFATLDRIFPTGVCWMRRW